MHLAKAWLWGINLLEKSSGDSRGRKAGKCTLI